MAGNSPTAKITQVPTTVLIHGAGNARVTQAATSVLAVGDGRARVTQTLANVLGIGEGRARVTQVAVNVLVASAVLQSIVVAPAHASTGVGKTVAFTAMGHYSDGTSKDLTAQVRWTANDATHIDASGVATVAVIGDATITATAPTVVVPGQG